LAQEFKQKKQPSFQYVCGLGKAGFWLPFHLAKRTSKAEQDSASKDIDPRFINADFKPYPDTLKGMGFSLFLTKKVHFKAKNKLFATLRQSTF
jgi:hypothetical protein